MLVCPQCKGKTIIRQSRHVTENTKKRYYICQGQHCGLRFVSFETLTRLLRVPVNKITEGNDDKLS